MDRFLTTFLHLRGHYSKFKGFPPDQLLLKDWYDGLVIFLVFFCSKQFSEIFLPEAHNNKDMAMLCIVYVLSILAENFDFFATFANPEGLSKKNWLDMISCILQ